VKDLLVAPVATYTVRPHFEGANIQTWIGFKHFVYLVQEAVLEHFRQQGFGPHCLFTQYGLCLEFVELRARLLHPLFLDNEVNVQVQSRRPASGNELSLTIGMSTTEGVDVLAGKVNVLFRMEGGTHSSHSVPGPLAPHVCAEIKRSVPDPRPPVQVARVRGPAAEQEVVDQLLRPNPNAFVWKWRIPYFFCHFSRRLELSGYVRLLEEVVDLFLADRGISIRTMLETHRWIPVVSEVHLEVLREAHMEEVIYTVYAVEDVLKDLAYTARMDCYVPRDGELVRTATGRIVHGYAEIRDQGEAALARFDASTIAALRGQAP